MGNVQRVCCFKQIFIADSQRGQNAQPSGIWGKTAGYISTVTKCHRRIYHCNTITSVKISKVDITDQKEVAGAHIRSLVKMEMRRRVGFHLGIS